jgi:hypothetical protein
VRRRLAVASVGAALVLGGCGGGEDGDGGGGSDEPKPAGKAKITKQPEGERVLRDALETFVKGKADMTASLQQDLRENDTKTLVDDLWDLRNVIYAFDQAVRRIDFTDGLPNHLSLTILEIDRAAIGRIDPILDAKKPPPGLADAVERAVEDAQAVEAKAKELFGLRLVG